MGQENFSVKFRAAGCKYQQASDGRRALCRTPSSRTRELRLHSGWAGARVDLSDRSPMASEDLTLQPPWPRAALGPQPTAAWEGRGPGSRRRSTLPRPATGPRGPHPAPQYKRIVGLMRNGGRQQDRFVLASVPRQDHAYPSIKLLFVMHFKLL